MPAQGSQAKFDVGVNTEAGSALLRPWCPCELILASESVMQPAALGTEEIEGMARRPLVNVLGAFKRKG